MDFFLEARWFFEEEDRVTWYEEVARKLVIAPRIPRFGILQQKCSNLTIPENPRGECNDIIMHRMVTDEPMKLFSDIGNMENNNPCKRCIEEEYEDATEELHTNIGILFGVLAMELGKAGNGELAAKYESILSNLDRQAAIDFYNYNVIRNLYAELGAPDYMKNKDNLNMFLCTIMQCDPTSTTYEEAKQALLFHADHAFSSSVTSGNPLPSWGDNGEGYFMEGDSPVGGSGLNLTGIFGSMAIYFDLANYMQPNWDPLYENGKFASPNDAEWTRFVETDPIYKYFMAGETQMTGREYHYLVRLVYTSSINVLPICLRI